MSSFLSELMDANGPPEPAADLSVYFARIAPLAGRIGTIERAARAGFAADRLGYAFAGGYQAALARLAPGEGRACLAATEEGGGHPRAIKTRLSPRDGGFVLTGVKTFATLARAADVLLVVASEGERGGRNALRVVRVPASRAGIAIADLPPTPFAPEIPHATVRFDDAKIEPGEVLPGDGYDRYLKPFRTIEDAHVLAATLGYVAHVAIAYGWPRPSIEAIFAHLAALVTIGGMAPLDRGAHVALAGALAGARETLGDAASHWANAPDEVQARWLRDAPLLHVADRARAARSAAAWRVAADPE